MDGGVVLVIFEGALKELLRVCRFLQSLILQVLGTKANVPIRRSSLASERDVLRMFGS